MNPQAETKRCPECDALFYTDPKDPRTVCAACRQKLEDLRDRFACAAFWNSVYQGIPGLRGKALRVDDFGDIEIVG